MDNQEDSISEWQKSQMAIERKCPRCGGETEVTPFVCGKYNAIEVRCRNCAYITLDTEPQRDEHGDKTTIGLYAGSCFAFALLLFFAAMLFESILCIVLGIIAIAFGAAIIAMPRVRNAILERFNKSTERQLSGEADKGMSKVDKIIAVVCAICFIVVIATSFFDSSSDSRQYQTKEQFAQNVATPGTSEY